MQRLKRFILPVLVAVLALFAVGDFIAAPLTTAGYIKNKIGIALVRQEIRQTYNQAVRLAQLTDPADSAAGRNAVNQFCSAPIEKLGFYYVCSAGWAAELNSGTEGVAYDLIFVESFVSQNEANDTKLGRTDHDLRYQHDLYYTGESPKIVDRRGFALVSLELGHRPYSDRR